MEKRKIEIETACDTTATSASRCFVWGNDKMEVGITRRRTVQDN